MFPTRAAALAVFILGLPAGGGVAAEPPRADDLAAARPNVIRVGPTTGDAEKDTVGFGYDERCDGGHGAAGGGAIVGATR
jgi:hypothetical protein